MRRILPWLIGLCLGCGSGSDQAPIAEAGGQALAPLQLAGYLDLAPAFDPTATGRALTEAWIDLTLLSAAVGNGILATDSALAREALEPLVRAEYLRRLQNLVVVERPPWTKEAIDLALSADTARLFQHVLVRVADRKDQAVLLAMRARADSVRILAEAGASFGELARRYSQSASGPFGGGTRLLTRATVPNAHRKTIWGLAPGEVSDLLDTAEGFEIYRRPLAAEVRDEMIVELMVAANAIADSIYTDSLAAADKLTMAKDVGSRMRQLLQRPSQTAPDSGLLATALSGGIGAAEALIWLGNVPDQVRSSLVNESDHALEQTAISVARNVVLYREAVRRGVVVRAEELNAVRRDFTTAMAAATRPFAGLVDPAARARVVDSLIRGAVSGQAAAPMPAGVPLLLRRRAEYRVYDDRLRAMVARRMAQADSGSGK